MEKNSFLSTNCRQQREFQHHNYRNNCNLPPIFGQIFFMQQLIECVPNFSEGRDMTVIKQITDVIETVEKVHQAIAANKKVAFQYFDYNLQKEKVLKFDGWQYKLSPYILVWNNDQYYLVGYFEKYKKVTKFCLDRITCLEILEEERIPQRDDFTVADYFEKEFSMLAGEHVKVELLCQNHLMSSMIDKFGSDLETEIVDDDHFKALVEVALSGTFYGWVFASRGAMKIIAPEKAKNRFDTLVSLYK